MHDKFMCNRMTTNQLNHSMVPCHPKLCGKITAQLSCLNLYILMRLTGVPISLFSKIYLSKSFSILHHMHAKSIHDWTTTKKNKSQHGALPSKTLWQIHRSTLVPLPVYVDETNLSICSPLLKNKSQLIIFHSAPHACQVYMQVYDNKQTKS